MSGWKILIDIEAFRLAKQARRGIVTDPDKWRGEAAERELQ